MNLQVHLITVCIITLCADKCLSLSLIDIFFTSGPSLETVYREKIKELRSELKLITRKICVRLDDEATKDMIRQLTCVEENFNSHRSSMMSIWYEATGSPYPTDLKQWRRFICSTKNFKILKSLIDGVYIGRLLPSESIRTALDPFKKTFKTKCPNLDLEHLILLFSFKNLTYQTDGSIAAPQEWSLDEIEVDEQFEPTHGILGDEDDFDETVDFCDLQHNNLTQQQKKYCDRKVAYTQDSIYGCVRKSEKGAAIRKKWIQQHQCLAESIKNDKRGIKKLQDCWRLITGERYPSDPNEFINFTCSHVYPSALRRTIDLCYEDRINNRFVSADFIRKWLQNYISLYSSHENNSCTADVWKESEIKMLDIYSRRYYRLQHKFEKHSFCTSEENHELIGKVIKDATCLMRKTTSEGKTILKFCWKFAGQVKYPRSLLEWKNLLCSRESKQMAQIVRRINSCFVVAPDIIFGYKNHHKNYPIVHYFFGRVQECSHEFPFASFHE